MMIAAIIVCVVLTLVLFGWVALMFMGHLADKQVEKLKGTTERDLADMFVFVDYRKLAVVYFLGFIAVPALVWLFTDNMVFTLLSLPVPIIAPKLIVNFVRKRRMDKFRNQLPDALAVMASSLRAGASVMTTLENLAKEAHPPLSQEFSLMLRNQRMGMTFEDALGKMEERIPLEEMGLFTAGVRISRETGGNLGEMLDSLAGTITRTIQVEGKIRSLTSMGKIQGLVMTSLPPLMIVVLTQLQPREMAPLFTSMPGYMTLGVIVIMEILGFIGIRKITNIDV